MGLLLVAQLEKNYPQKRCLTEKQKSAIALLELWIAEKEQLTPEELERNDVEFEEFKANINRWRAEEGRAPAFP